MKYNCLDEIQLKSIGEVLMEFESALEHALNGDAVLFVGAGFSRMATNLRGAPLKGGIELARHLSNLVNLPEDTALDDAAEEFVQVCGEDALVVELKQEYTTSDIHDVHLKMARVPWRRIYTTNYDNVLEVSYSRVSRPLTPVVTADDFRKVSGGDKSDTICMHLNGYIDRVSRETISSEIKLTDSSYLTASIESSPMSTLFRQDLGLARAVFFVGYSLADLDIRRLLYEDPVLKEKCFFILGTPPHAQTSRRASRFGNVVDLDTSGFSSAIQEKAERYDPPDFTQRLGYSVREFAISTERSSFSDQLVFDLLLLGDKNSQIIWESLHEGPRYFLERSFAEEALARLYDGNKIAIVHSELGNGKTLLLEGIKCRSLEGGFKVYTVSVRADDLFRELDEVLQSSAKTLIVIDDYADWFDVIQYIHLHRNASTSLILASRSSVHDVMIERLSEVTGIEEFPEIPVDRLNKAEVNWIIDFFNEYGLWAEKAAWSRRRKENYLSERCGGRFYAILIMLLESPQIALRFDKILGELNNKRSYYEVILSILVLTVLHHESSLNTLIDIWGSRVLNSGFRRNQSVGELIDLRGGEIRLRSAVAAEFVLKNVANVNITVDALIAMARSADVAGGVLATYRSLLTKLMRFNNVQNILPEKQKSRAIIRYYEGIKNLNGCRNNPQFWLQYAIACLVIEEFERAERYFKTAYALAKARSQNTYQIDNHYARFLLLTSVESGNATNCMSAFRRARTIIYDQIKEERMHYPYRVAQLFSEFYEAFRAKLEPAQVDEIVNAATFVSNRIESLPEERRRHRNVVDCYNAMNYINEMASIEN